MKQFIFFVLSLVFTFSLTACSPERTVQRVFGNPEVIVEIVDINGNPSTADLGPNGSLYEDTLYYLKGTVFRNGRPVPEGNFLSNKIEWEEITSGYKIINFLELPTTNKETYSGNITQIKTGILQGSDTQKDALIEVRAFFAHAPKKQYRFTIIKKS